MLNNLMKAFLFLSSYFPLYLILFIKYISISVEIAIIFIFLSFISILGLILFFKIIKDTNPTSVTIKSIKNKDSEVMAYVVSYFFPFLSFNLTQITDQIIVLSFYIMIAIIYVRSNIIHINPTLVLFRYFLYEIESESGSKLTLLTKKSRVIKDSKIKVVRVNDWFLVENNK